MGRGPSAGSPEGADGRALLLLLPGTLCDDRLFAALVARLGGERPVLVDPMDGAATAPALAEAVLARSPPRFALAGFSLGGIVALEMVAQAPNRIERLALIDTTARPDPPANAERRRAAVAAARRNIDGYVLDAWDGLVAPANRGRDDIRSLLLAMARAGGAERLAAQTGVAIHRADGRPRLPAIRVPTLVVAGEHEAVCPLDAHREIAAAVPGAVLRLVPGAGHFAPLENPDAVARHLRDWLRPEGAQHPAFHTERQPA